MPPQQSLVPLDLRAPLEETLALLRGQFEQRQIAHDIQGLRADIDRSQKSNVDGHA